MTAEPLRLIDHHCHGATTGDLDRTGFEALATESDRPPPAGCSTLDSQLGFALRRWCAPVLGLPPHVDGDAYLARRRELGAAEANRLLLRAAEVDAYLVDTGFNGARLLGPAEMASAAGTAAHEVVRLETVAEEQGEVTAEGFAEAYAESLARATARAVGVKSIVAYRHGLDFDPRRPTRREVVEAAGRWLRDGRPRIADPVLLRHLLWAGVDRGLPVQLHTGFGDPDLDLARCDPALLTGFLRATRDSGVPIMLLHCYPFHRQAGYLAQAFPHVYVDAGLALNHVGARAAAVLAESLELAPFHKVLYSSDAYGLAELHQLGAVLFRRAFAEVTGAWVRDGHWSAGDAARAGELIGSGNARRVYGLD
ncbi:amidohydrolase family protein [Actinoplanes sp. KI2]|uniref:amidohydrolase family protein n=1 Tax=Actinoplanes sp. KI2 TaxID=2983315 RepID=UPI0021D577C1|nr:amidohydrolase family protein [Actinoplanes sp. KI2]MCU7728494.1 amidohydrolase family protein [Actinoplanes sp. KI2]